MYVCMYVRMHVIHMSVFLRARMRVFFLEGFSLRWSLNAFGMSTLPFRAWCRARTSPPSAPHLVLRFLLQRSPVHLQRLLAALLWPATAELWCV